MATEYAPIVESIVSKRQSSLTRDVFRELYGDIILEYPFEGVSSEVTIEHNRGTPFVEATFIQSDGVQVYPKLIHKDTNTVIVISNVPLIGTLYII